MEGVYYDIRGNLEELYKMTEIGNLINEHVLIKKDRLKKLIIDYLTINYEKDDNDRIKIKRDNHFILVTNIEVEYKKDLIDKEDYTWMIYLSYRLNDNNKDETIDFNIEAFLKRSLEEFFDDYIFKRLSEMISEKDNQKD